MRLPTRAGVLAAGVSGGGGAAFVDEKHYVPAGATQAVSFADAEEGNLAVVMISNSLSGLPPTPSGWTRILNYTWATFGYNESCFYKELDAADIIAGSVTFSSLSTDTHVMALFYSGPTAATVVTYGDAQTSTVTAPGFTKSVGCQAIAMWCSSRSQASTPAAPGTTVNRIPNFTSSNFVARADDILNPSNYTDGSDLPYTGCGVVEAVVTVLELT